MIMNGNLCAYICLSRFTIAEYCYIHLSSSLLKQNLSTYPKKKRKILKILNSYASSFFSFLCYFPSKFWVNAVNRDWFYSYPLTYLSISKLNQTWIWVCLYKLPTQFTTALMLWGRIVFLLAQFFVKFSRSSVFHQDTFIQSQQRHQMN